MISFVILIFFCVFNFNLFDKLVLVDWFLGIFVCFFIHFNSFNFPLLVLYNFLVERVGWDEKLLLVIYFFEI